MSDQGEGRESAGLKARTNEQASSLGLNERERCLVVPEPSFNPEPASAPPQLRVERIGDATLYLGDCREMVFGHHDACITDPPYGVKNKAQSGYDTRKLKGLNITRHRWAMIEGDDAKFDPAWLFPPSFRFRRMVLWGANHYASHLPNSAAWIIWDKRGGVARDDNADCEMAWTNFKGVARVHTQLWKGICRAGEENIAVGGSKLHPHQKPVALLDYCLELAKLKPGESVFDPYMGSGSCGVAAARRGLYYTGCEIDPAFFDIACRRIEEAYRQPRLFGEPASKIVQGALFDSGCGGADTESDSGTARLS